jgi:hypothetical protein
MIEAYKDVVRKGTYTHVQGRLRVDYWGENKEKFRHVIEADTVRARLGAYRCTYYAQGARVLAALALKEKPAALHCIPQVVVAAPAEKQAPAASKKASPAPPPPAAPAAAPRAQQQPQARQAQHSQQPAAAAPPAPAPAPAAQKQQQPYGQQKQQAAGSGYSKANSAGAAAAPAAPAKDADLTQLSPADKWAHLGAYPGMYVRRVPCVAMGMGGHQEHLDELTLHASAFLHHCGERHEQNACRPSASQCLMSWQTAACLVRGEKLPTQMAVNLSAICVGHLCTVPSLAL